MTVPRYSVCVVHYGDPRLTAECLASVERLVPEPAERIVVWNGPDRCADSLASRAQVRALEPGANLGFAAGANLGIESALALPGVEAVLLLNNDVEVEPDCARRLLEVLGGDGRVAIAGPRILATRTRTIWHDGGDIDWPDGRPVAARAAPAAPGDAFETGFISGCAPLIRGNAFRETGGFDTRYFFSYEDADLSLRLRSRGWRLVQVPAAIVHHHGSAALPSDTPASRYYRLRNRLLFMREHAPDRAAAACASRRLERRSRVRAAGCYLTGRPAEGRALFAALRDARRSRFGRWRDN
ncbi:MAG: glycosyltransferase family 2 protein [Planctomycetes bacterium]|nr:glycosyltransferase family 2 protein [Planctomycetota bacterium]